VGGVRVDKVVWNGKWGHEAKCYSNIGLCKKGTACHQLSCIAEIDSTTNSACINKEIPISECNTRLKDECIRRLKPKEASICEKDIMQTGFTCPSGDKVYFKLGDKYYLKNGNMVVLGSGRKICANKEVTESGEITIAQRFTTDRETAIFGLCAASETYVRGPALYDYFDANGSKLANSYGFITKTLMNYGACYANVANSINGYPCPTKYELVDDAYCQCMDEVRKKWAHDDGKLKTLDSCLIEYGVKAP